MEDIKSKRLLEGNIDQYLNEIAQRDRAVNKISKMLEVEDGVVEKLKITIDQALNEKTLVDSFKFLQAALEMKGLDKYKMQTKEDVQMWIIALAIMRDFKFGALSCGVNDRPLDLEYDLKDEVEECIGEVGEKQEDAEKAPNHNPGMYR